MADYIPKAVLRSTVSGWSLFFMKLFAPDLHLINEWTFKGITREIDTYGDGLFAWNRLAFGT